MKGKKLVSILLLAVFMLSLIPMAVMAANPITSPNVINGNIYRYGSDGSVSEDLNYDEPLSSGEVRISQQIIAEYDDGIFDVELKVQNGLGLNALSEAAIVFVLDRSGIVSPDSYAQMKSACIAMVDSFPDNADIHFGIIIFSYSAENVLQGQNDSWWLTNDRTIAKTNLAGLAMPIGPRNTGAGLQSAADALERYTGNGPKYVVVVTAGQADRGPSGYVPPFYPREYVSQTADYLEAKGVTTYAFGVGNYNEEELTIIAKSQDRVYTMETYAELEAALVGITKPSGSVTVDIASEFDLVEVLSGSNYSVDPSNSILNWKPDEGDANGICSLVYKIQMKEEEFNEGFKQISSSAMYSYFDADSEARNVKFHVPYVQYTTCLHDGGTYDEVTLAPTCEDSGLKDIYCDDCNQLLEENVVIPALGHDWDDGVVTTPPTETEDGLMTYTCLRCGETRTETIPAIGGPGDVTLVSATATASIEILSGNQNKLTITITELYSDGSTVTITTTLLIKNNATDTYQVGDYLVYVDTKGNDQIRACYIVE